MDAIWGRIEAWLAVNAPTIAAGLNPPATLEALAETEQFVGVQFPDEVRATYLRHDGQHFDSPGLLEGWEWLSLGRVRDEWQVWKGLLDGGDFDGVTSYCDDQQVCKDWWNPAWIPLTYSGMGDHHCLDFAPGPQGVPGQIIEMWHDEGQRPVVAPSFAEWLADFAAELEAGAYVMSEEFGGLCLLEDA